MTNVDKLNQRIGEVERHVLTSADSQQAMVARIKDGLSAIHAGFVRKQVEIEEQKDEITRLRYENGRLRMVLDRLLQSVEQSCAGELKGVLSDLETRIADLVDLAEAEVTVAEEPADVAPRDRTDPEPADRSAVPGEAAAPQESSDADPEATEEATPARGKSAWLAEVMQRAAALSAEIGDPDHESDPGRVAVVRNVAAYGPEPKPLSQPPAAADGQAA